jgi:hypothetical protein
VGTRRSVSRPAGDVVGIPVSREQWDPSKYVGGSRKVAIRGPREICMVEGHTRTECGKCVTCWLALTLHGVH